MDPEPEAVGSLLSKLHILVAGDEYKLPKSVLIDLKTVSRSLPMVWRYLMNKSCSYEPVDQLEERQKVIREVVDLAYDMERVVLKFMASQLRAPSAGQKAFFAMMRFKLATAKGRHQFITNVRGFKHRMMELTERRAFKWTIDTLPPRPIDDLRQDADHLVGLEGRVVQLVKILLPQEEEEEGTQLKMASVVGDAGVGKTTLVNQAYHRLKPDFECTAWVTMSNVPDIGKNLWTLLTQISKQDDDADYGSMDVQQMIDGIREALKDKRYFIVFDDIWDVDAWDTIKHALIENSNHSAVVTTNRTTDVALHAGVVYTLGPLSKTYSRQLFCKRVFGSEDSVPPMFADISEKILEKCSGIPSAIITTAGLLLDKPLEDWPAVLDNDYRDLHGLDLAPMHTNVADRRALAFYTSADGVVGLDSPVEKIVKFLTEDLLNGTKVVSVVGQAGVGKTTLAALVYQRLKPLFDCTAWVTVSTDPNRENVLSSLLRQLNNYHNQANFGSIDETIAVIWEALSNKRCLIVLDDIWNDETLDDILSDLENSNGNAVVTTSRITAIARCVGDVYTLAPLSAFYSRQLFHGRLFGPGEECPPELAESSEKILQKCSGIPLAIISTAGLLAGRTKKDDWYAVLNSNGYGDLHGMRIILALSYTNLPVHQQSCLLYLSMFQKGCEISVDRLVWGWVAEDFIYGTRMKEEAMICLRDLISGHLVEAVKVDVDGEVLSCRVYDMVHDLIVSLCAEENFATILDGQQDRSLPGTIHRLSIQGNSPLPPQERLSNVRSLFVSGDVSSVPSLSKFENLRLLDLGGCDSLQNLKDIGSLFRLKYLVMGANCKIDISIRNLSFLQILDLRASNVKELSVSILLIRQLRYLYVNSRTKIPDGIGKLEALEELKDINISKPELLKELCSLNKLKVLGIVMWSWDESSGDAVLEHMRSLMQERNIRSLSILTNCSLNFLEDPLLLLEKLEIRHTTFLALPRWISSAYTLFSLSIAVHKLSQEIIDMLGQLGHLGCLSLTSKHAPDPECKCTGGFSNLGSFHFVSNAMGNIFGPGAMPYLERLNLSFEASRTKDLSPGFAFGLENLFSLKHVRVQIICFNASPKLVDQAAAAITKAIFRDPIRLPSLEIRRLQEEHMVEDEEVPQDINYSTEQNKSSESAGGDKPVPNANEPDEVGTLLTQLMIDNMHLQLQLKVKDMVRDNRLNETETLLLVQAAKDRIEDLMKQVLDVGCGPSNITMPDFRTLTAYNSGFVERFCNLRKSSGQHERHLGTDEMNSIIDNTVLEPEGRGSTSTFHYSDETMNNTPQMEHHKIQNVSEENMCTEQDNQAIAHINSSKVSDILVRIDDICIPKEIMNILKKEFVHDGSEKYLDDKLIDASIYCLREKYPGCTRDGGKVFLEITKTCQLLSRDGKHAMFKGTIEKDENIKTAINYLKHDMIFMPFNREQHWYLAVISAKHQEIQVLDSLASHNTEREELMLAVKGIEIYLALAANEETIKTNRWPNLKITSWKVRMVEGLPNQEDGSSCGLFMLKYMEYWTGDRLSMSFTQDDVHQFRKNLAAMLVNNPLNQVSNKKETEVLNGHQSC